MITYNFNDFISVLFLGWFFIYIFNYIVAGFMSLFYNRFDEQANTIKIAFRKK